MKFQILEKMYLNNLDNYIIKMKTNFRKNENPSSESDKKTISNTEQKDLTQEEFEDYITKSGAKGSFMVYRSNQKDEELGLEEL